MGSAISVGCRPSRSNVGALRISAYLLAGVVALSVLIGGASKWLGHTIALGGHSDDQTVHEVVIGNNVIAAPANTIRFEKSRRSGIAERLDIYLSWPDLDGYSDAKSAEFNNLGKHGSIIFLTFEPRIMSRDMSGRFDPIYRKLIQQPGKPGPGDITFYAFAPNSGYADEELAVAGNGETQFVARCLTGPQAEQALAECQRDVFLSDDLSLSYRFPIALLANWKAMESAVLERAHFMLKTGAPADKP